MIDFFAAAFFGAAFFAGAGFFFGAAFFGAAFLFGAAFFFGAAAFFFFATAGVALPRAFALGGAGFVAFALATPQRYQRYFFAANIPSRYSTISPATAEAATVSGEAR